MTRTDFLGATATLALGAFMALLLLRPTMGERWFGLYGEAAVAIPVAIAGGLILSRRFRATDRSPWRALLFAVPILVLALAQIGYWTAFFAAGPSGVGLALMRTVIRDVAGPWLPFAATVLAALLAWPFVSAAREPHR